LTTLDWLYGGTPVRIFALIPVVAMLILLSHRHP